MQREIANTGPRPEVTTDSSSDEIEIDLRKYADIVTSRWRLLLTSVVIAAILGGLISVTVPPSYEATATIALVKTATQVAFDERIKTVTQGDTNTTTADTRRATYVGLVENAAIANAIAKQLDTLLTNEEKNPARLLEKIDAAASGRGDLVLIKVRDSSPQKAAAIATAWAQEYERFVNNLYAGAPAEYSTSVDNEYQRAVQDASQAQTAFEGFIKTSQIDSLQRSISETQQLLDTLQLGKQIALTSVISEQLKVNSEIISAYLGAQSANRLVAFQKEQEGRRELVEAYLTALNLARVRVISEQVNSDLSLLSTLQNTKARMRQFIGDAAAMRDQVQQGGDAAVQSNSIALSLLKSQVFALNVPLSTTVQLQLSPVATTATASELVTDLNGLIASLKGREKSLTEEIKSVSDRLLSGTSYDLDVSKTDTSALSVAISNTYPLLFEVGEIGKLSEAVPITNPLTLAAQDKAKEILTFNTDSLSAGALVGNTSSDKVIQQLQGRLTVARANLEGQQSTFEQLQRERNLKRDTADSLARKQAEVSLSKAIASSEVRLASQALPPERPVTGRSLFVGIAALVGLLLGVVMTFIANAVIGADPAKVPGTGGFARAARWVLLPH